MQEIHTSSLWTEIKRLTTVTSHKVAAVAYVTDDKILQFGDGDLPIVDASDNAIKAGQTDRGLLQRAFDRGAELFSCPGLHAKITVFDATIAIIGSANFSRSSQRDLIEAALVTDDAECVAAAKDFVDRLADESDRIDKSFLDRIGKLEVERSKPFSKRRPNNAGKMSKEKTNSPHVENAAMRRALINSADVELRDGRYRIELYKNPNGGSNNIPVVKKIPGSQEIPNIWRFLSRVNKEKKLKVRELNGNDNPIHPRVFAKWVISALNG